MNLPEAVDRVPDQPYPELHNVLARFIAELRIALADNLFGVYLIGSLASGDFDLDSDVDFLVVTRGELEGPTVRDLEDMHIRLHRLGCYPAEHLEGSYMTRGDLNDWNIVGKKRILYLENGSTRFEQSMHDNKWHVRWILRELGISLIGPNPKSILPPIPIGEMMGEVRATIHNDLHAFADEIDRPISFWNSRFGQSFTVLHFCRMLHTLHTGRVESKLAGIQWAQQIVESKWTGLIRQAWNEREGVRFGTKRYQRADPKLLYETLEFLQYISRQSENLPLRPPRD